MLSSTPRPVLMRRVEFALLGAGGLFLVLGWGIGHAEWARAVGWLLAGFGFAIEMVHGHVRKVGALPAEEPEPRVSDEAAPRTRSDPA